jgi:hypothetical protein
MAKLLKLRVGVSDDPTALQPSLNDCLEAMLQQADHLVEEVIEGLVAATAASGPRRVPAFQQSGIKQGILRLSGNGKAVAQTFKAELTRLVYEGGGKEQAQTELLRFEDLQLFGDEQLDQSIEVARAQQEVLSAVDDTLPQLDALVSTLLGWRTIQPGLNPIRPDVFVRALQTTLAQHVPQSELREIVITPAAGMLGVNLRKLYREIAEWLRSTGVEPAVPLGGRTKGPGTATATVTDTVAKTLLTLDKLRKLLAGDFDAPAPKQDFLYTVPASMAMLHDDKQVDALVKRLERRPKASPPPAGTVDMLAQPQQAPSATNIKIGQQLGEEVVRLMFDNLAQDSRLLPSFKRELRKMEPAVDKLARQDSRFFSDKNHPARQLLDRITQRSLAFSSESDNGFPRFMKVVEEAVQWLDSKVVDADTFGELLDNLQQKWGGQDQDVKVKREEAAKALLHAEQRNLLAQKLGNDFLQSLDGLDVADFIRDFLRNSWAQVVAEEQLACTDGNPDPHGYRALVDDLIWSVQKSTAQRGRARRLVQMIPGLLARLREGLQRIGYPPELTQRFFDHLITLHRAAVQEGRDAAMQAAADEAWAEQSGFSDSASDEVQMWLDENEVKESGYVQAQELELDFVSSPFAAQQEAKAVEQENQKDKEARMARERLIEEKRRHQEAAAAASDAAAAAALAAPAASPAAPVQAAQAGVPPVAPPAAAVPAPAPVPAARPAPVLASVPVAAPAAVAAPQPEPEAVAQAPDAARPGTVIEETAAAAPAEHMATGAHTPLRAAEELRIGSWVEIEIKGAWVRAQLTWSSPHNTLFMFTSIAGTAHSMSKRTLDKLRSQGQLKVVAERPLIDEALDQVAQAALKNSLDTPKE